MKNIFNILELPFEELEESLGLTKKMLLDFPQDVLDKLLTGRLSPLLQISITADDGKKYKLPAKIGFRRNSVGVVELRIYPKMKELQNTFNIKKKEFKALQEGKVVNCLCETDGKKERLYFQLDKETNTVMSASTQDVYIPNTIRNVSLGSEQKSRIRAGEPIEIEIEGSKITVGVNLNEANGFRLVKGDIAEWEKRKLIEWDRITPNATGYWQTSENGWEYQAALEESLNMKR